MTTLIITIISFIVGFIIGYAIHYAIITLHYSYMISKNTHGKHFCNHCKTAFNTNTEEINYYKYCPYCGRALELHEDDPAYISESQEGPFDNFS